MGFPLLSSLKASRKIGLPHLTDGRLAGSLLGLQVLLLTYGALIHSPTWDEPGHLAAGISHWTTGSFRVYNVNPPLVRLIATSPILFTQYSFTSIGSAYTTYARPEYGLGCDFVKKNGSATFNYLTIARLVCIPFSVLGGFTCWIWGNALYRKPAGLFALALWTLCPNILANGQLITPDIAATSLGLLASFLFWRWLISPSWKQVPFLGLIFGLTQLTKFTWILLFGIWPMLWAIRTCSFKTNLHTEVKQLLSTLLIGVYVINLGYGFAGTFDRLRDYDFASSALGGHVISREPGNRFRETILGSIPMPLPREYISGIDLQKFDFDRGLRSYLRGEWNGRGWWYFYLYGLTIKVPLGTWLIILLTLIATFSRKTFLLAKVNEAALLFPAIGLLLFASAQTGFSHHLRYVLPCFPFIFIWASKLVTCCRGSCSVRHLSTLVVAGLTWSLMSSLWIYPHSQSYFNELVGGPTGGHWHLGSSNIDWGQDLLLIKAWYDEHSEARPLHLAYELPLIDPRICGIDSEPVPKGPKMNRPGSPKTVNWPWRDDLDSRPPSVDKLGPIPGWFVLGINQIHHPNGEYEYFLDFRPAEMIGYATYVYHISLVEANNCRARLGLPPLLSMDSELESGR